MGYVKSTMKVLLIGILVTGCVRGSGRSPAAHSDPGPSSAAGGRVFLDLGSTTAGRVVRELGAFDAGGIVLMKGLEARSVAAFKFDGSFSDAVDTLADRLGCRVHKARDYLFLYTRPYEALTDLDLASDLPKGIARAEASIAFAANTPLYHAFALLSQGLGMTIVGDNAVADAVCGELALGNVPVGVGIEALLQSARVARSSIVLESDGDYLFIRSAANEGLIPVFLEGRGVRPSYLDRRITLTLPALRLENGIFRSPLRAETLAAVLPSLSKQLGVTVHAGKGTEGLPVNPSVFSDVTVGTAMALLIRQWLAPEFRYEAGEDGIVIRRVAPPRP